MTHQDSSWLIIDRMRLSAQTLALRRQVTHKQCRASHPACASSRHRQSVGSIKTRLDQNGTVAKQSLQCDTVEFPFAAAASLAVHQSKPPTAPTAPTAHVVAPGALEDCSILHCINKTMLDCTYSGGGGVTLFSPCWKVCPR